MYRWMAGRLAWLVAFGGTPTSTTAHPAALARRTISVMLAANVATGTDWLASFDPASMTTVSTPVSRNASKRVSMLAEVLPPMPAFTNQCRAVRVPRWWIV